MVEISKEIRSMRILALFEWAQRNQITDKPHIINRAVEKYNVRYQTADSYADTVIRKLENERKTKLSAIFQKASDLKALYFYSVN